MADPDSSPAPTQAPTQAAKTSKTPAKRLRRIVLLGIGPLAILAGGLAYVDATYRYVTTENAYVKADKIAISTEISGHVARVEVRENDIVMPGQLLFALDQERFRIAVEQKQAALEAERQTIEGLRALYRQKRAEFGAVREEIAYYDGEYQRAQSLKKQGHISHSKYEETRRDRLMARHQLEAVRQDIDGVVARLGGDPDMPIDMHPDVMAAITELEEARLDFGRTAVFAPTKAIVSNIDLQVGEYVELGEPVFSLVDVEHFWIEANLKETDLTHLREGQVAEVKVDAYPDHTWQARVSGIAPATGAEFALLPPQNASGNWVKVVQRVPVRLSILRTPDEPPLRAGMSVKVSIDTGVEMEWPGPVRDALAWVREKP